MPVSGSASLDDLRIDRSRRSPRRAIAAGLLLVVVIALAALAAWWWAGRSGADAVRVVAVTADSTPAGAAGVLNASGYVTARRRATVSSRITGRITEVRVEEGMRVRAGEVLARLDDGPLRAYLRLSEAQLGSARRSLDEIEVRLREADLRLGRTRRLVAAGIAGQADLDTVQAEYDAITARLATAREQVAVAERQVGVQQTELLDTIIRAPFDGIAVSKDAQPGEMVSPVSAGGGFTRTGICTLVDMASLEVEVDVSESYINRVHDGQRATARLDAYPDWPIPTRVITIVPTADRQKATLLVRLAFDALEPRILPDMGVKVVFLEAQPAAAPSTPRVIAPRAAVRRDGAADVVFVVHETTVERRGVRLGTVRDAEVQVVAGLSPGERVVLEPPATLGDGDRIRVRE